MISSLPNKVVASYLYICNMYLQEHHTERLIIRPLTKADIPAWTYYFNNPEHLRYIVLPPQENMTSLEKTEFWFDKQFLRYKENRFGLMALIDKNTGEFIGQCGLLTQEVDGDSVLEIGYHLLLPHWGKGYATEAAMYFKNWAFANLDNTELVSIIDVGNAASEKVAMRNGMTKWKSTVDYFNLTVNVYRVIRE